MTRKKSMTGFFALAALFHLSCGIIHPVTPTFLKSLSMSDYMYGVSMAAAAFMAFVCSPFIGRLNSVISSRKTTTLCCFGYALGQALFALSRTPAQILITRVLGGGLGGFALLGFITYVSAMSSDRDRGRNLAIIATLASGCNALGYFVGGMLGEISTSAAFIAQVAFLAICGALCPLVFENDVQEGTPMPPAKELLKEVNPFSAFIQCRRYINPLMLIFIIGMALSFMATTLFETNFNYYIKDQLALTSGYNGAFKAVIGVTTIVMNSTLCIWLMRHTDTDRSLSILFCLCALCSACIVFVPSHAVFIVLCIILLSLTAMNCPLLQNTIASRVPSRDRTLMLGLYNSVQSLGAVSGSLISGIIYSFNPKAPFFCGMLLFFIASVLSIVHAAGRRKESAEVCAEK